MVDAWNVGRGEKIREWPWSADVRPSDRKSRTARTRQAGDERRGRGFKISLSSGRFVFSLYHSSPAPVNPYSLVVVSCP